MTKTTHTSCFYTAYMNKTLHNKNVNEEFTLTQPNSTILDSDLESMNYDIEPIYSSTQNTQSIAQIELEGMDKPSHQVSLDHHSLTPKTITFQHEQSILELLEKQNVPIHYQCKEGYCGSCRTVLIEGDVHYFIPPIAWLNDNEILPCCCIPKSDLSILTQTK
jgi:ferredoxin